MPDALAVEQQRLVAPAALLVALVGLADARLVEAENLVVERACQLVEDDPWLAIL